MNEEDEAFNDIERQAKQRKESVKAAMQTLLTECERGAVVTVNYERKWKSLTKTQINAIACRYILKADGGQSFARAIEAKLKEKNT